MSTDARAMAAFRMFKVHPRQAAPWIYKRGETLDEVYGRYSYAKAYAYNECRKMCDALGGFNFAITSVNTFLFTVMFDFPHPETGELMRARITRCSNDCWYL